MKMSANIKRAFILLLYFVMVFNQMNLAIAVTEESELVFDVSSWSDFEEAFNYSDYQGEAYTIKLMNDLHYDAGDAPRSATALMDVHVRGCFVTLDFNGHTLSCTDKVSSTDLESALSDFIRINLHPINNKNFIEFRLTDSVGGGGVSMDSHRAYDNQLAALHIVETGNYMENGYFLSTYGKDKLIIDGGNYELNAKTEKVGRGTIDYNTFYRGTVIADTMYAVEINGGTFTAKSGGVVAYGDDMCARELSAYATCSNSHANPGGVMSGRNVINGGTFISDGYAIHHFDHSLSVDETRWMEFPRINGGIFSGSVGYIGMSFTYENYDTTGYGIKEYREKSAADIINSDALVRCLKDGKIYDVLEDLTLGDLHEAKSLYVISGSLFNFDTLPAITGDTTTMERNAGQNDTFKVLYDVPFYLTAYEVVPYISVTPNGGTETTRVTTEKTITYADYPSGLTVKAGITMNFAGEAFTCENIYAITVTEELKPATIISQPQSCTVNPGEYAEATVIADHAKAYQWYVYLEGYPIPLTDNLVAQLSGIKIEGYTTPTLRIAADSVSKSEFHCVITGADDSKTKTNRISFTFGGAPELLSFSGGEYYAGGDAEFTVYANYADIVTWKVFYRQSGVSKIYTPDEFAELTDCKYSTSHKGLGFYDELYKASITFKNVPESLSGKYSVGYVLENDLGKVSFNPDNTIEFKFSPIKPNINWFLTPQSCIEGGNMEFLIDAENMSSAEWTFEKADDEGIMFAYTLDDMRELFPDSSFVASTENGSAKLTISNVRSEMCYYTLYAKAYSYEGGSVNVGSARLNVISVCEFAIRACDENYRKITVSCPESRECTLYIAGYDNLGKLEELHIKTLNFARGKAIYDTGKNFGEHYNIKVMLWDNDTLTPLCDVAES